MRRFPGSVIYCIRRKHLIWMNAKCAQRFFTQQWMECLQMQHGISLENLWNIFSLWVMGVWIWAYNFLCIELRTSMWVTWFNIVASSELLYIGESPNISEKLCMIFLRSWLFPQLMTHEQTWDIIIIPHYLSIFNQIESFYCDTIYWNSKILKVMQKNDNFNYFEIKAIQNLYSYM